MRQVIDTSVKLILAFAATLLFMSCIDRLMPGVFS